MKRICDIHKKPERVERIIQFGEGGFLRGFADWLVQLTNECTDFNAGVVVVQPIAAGMCKRLEAQDCVYTHIMRGMRDGVPTVDKKVIDVISRTVEPYEDFESYLSLAEGKDFRFVISNTTESGIEFKDSDMPENAPNITFPAKLTLLLKRRYDLGLPGFIFLPCELIEKNGENLKKCVLSYASLWNMGEGFISFIENENKFCNTLVDRIVTGYPAGEELALGYEDGMVDTSELFFLWVIEAGAELLKELPIDKAGANVIVTDNLERYRTRKVRILNGAHTSMIPYALMSGLETVGDCMKNEKMRSFLHACVFDEIIPTLDLPMDELLAYANDVFERFENPFIRHLCSSISLNSVSKFRVRVLPSLLEYIKRKGERPANLMASFAYLIMFYKKGTPIDDEKIIDFMKRSDVSELLSSAELWGEDLSFLTADIEALIAKGI